MTAACYEHRPIINQSPERMSECEESVLAACRQSEADLHAWCILPNHYHVLLRTEQLTAVLPELGQFTDALRFNGMAQTLNVGANVGTMLLKDSFDPNDIYGQV